MSNVSLVIDDLLGHAHACGVSNDIDDCRMWVEALAEYLRHVKRADLELDLLDTLMVEQVYSIGLAAREETTQ